MASTRSSLASSRILSKVSLFDRLRWFSNTIFHQLIAVVSGFIFYILFKYNHFYNLHFQHYFLCTLAYVPLMAEGIILFSEANVWSLKVKRGAKYYIHGPLLLISTISVTIGISFQLYFKNQNKTAHFTTSHGITGFVSWLLTMLSVILGLCSFYSVKLRKLVRPVVFKSIHNFFGLAAFVLGATSLILGLNKHGFRLHVTDNEYLVTVWLLIIVTVSTGFMVIASFVNQLRSIL